MLKEEAPAESEKHLLSQQMMHQTTPEQQTAIDALDKPVLDEKIQDVPAEIANAPADEATADTETAGFRSAATLRLLLYLKSPCKCRDFFYK